MPKRLRAAATRARKRVQRMHATRASKAYSKYTVSRTNNAFQKNMVKVGRGFPSRMTFTHRYVDNFTMVSTLGSLDYHVFRMNGMYDPDFTSTGHQPMFFDQLTPIYEHYTVIGARITFHIVPATSTTHPAQFILFQNSASGATFATQSIIAEQNKATVRQTTMGSVRPTVLKLNFSAKKTFGGSVLGNPELQGTSVADPTEISFAYLGVRANDATVTATFYVRVTIDYISVWDERKVTAQS